MAFLVLMKINHPRRRSRAPFIRGAVAFGAIDAYTYAFIFFIEKVSNHADRGQQGGFHRLYPDQRRRDVIDSSAGGAPLVYLHGAGNIIVGLEKALEGKNVGDELSVAIEPEDAYGEYSAELVATLTREMFEGVDELEVGMQFHASAPDGGMQIVTIRDIDGDDVTVDGNHPLAGQRLNFKVKVVDVREANAEEIAHGHIHGEGGHHH